MPEMGQAGAQAVIWGWDGTDPQRVYAGALGATIAATQYGLVTKAVLYGYDGSTLSRLKVEDATNPNLRVALFSGVFGVATALTNSDPGTARALVTLATIAARDQAGIVQGLRCQSDGGDDESNSLVRLDTASHLYGYDGATWDRLRTYGTGILKMARAEAGLSNSGVLSADTAVKASAGKVYWLTVSDTAALALELNDSADNSGTDLWAIDLPANGYCHFIFDPPIEFSAGIYLDVSTATCKVTIGYL